MFAPQHDYPPSLRQGDVVASVFFPLPRPESLKYLASYVSGAGTKLELQPFVESPPKSTKQYVLAASHGVVAHGSVISQCCDLDRKHPKASFSLCRLIPFERTRYRNVDALMGNIDPWGLENPHFQFFYLGQINGLDGEYVADFGLLTSLSWLDYESVLSKKVHQLDSLNRNKFRVKVGAFFGRPTEEDSDGGLANPYAPTVAANKGWLKRIGSFFRAEKQA